MNHSYFVVHTQPNCETRAFNHLRLQSYDVYFPKISVRRVHARRVEFVPRPFLPRYMFVADDGRGVSAIKRSYGVNDVVRAGQEPVRIRGSEVQRIQLREDAAGMIVLDDAVARPFREGEMLRIKADSAELASGYNAIFRRMRGETRALIFLCTAIGTVKTEVDVGSLEKVNVAA